MVRILILALLISLACRAILGKWPWDYLRLSATRSQAVKRARSLLGVGADASHAEIVEAHRRLIAMVHPDRGGTNAQIHEANDARDLLLAELPSPN